MSINKIDQAYFNLSNEIPDYPLLVQEFVDQHRASQPFAGVTALFFQHQLVNQCIMTRAMIDLGLAPEKIVWVDIPYSSNAYIRQYLIHELGLHNDNFHRYTFGLLEPYAIKQRARTNRIIRRLLETQSNELLVMDDGSYFLESCMCFEAGFENAAVVEQTTRGIAKIKSSAALQFEASKYPIINVAESEPKTVLEPPFIAKSVTIALADKFKALNFELEGKKVLILGYGRIGRSVARFIRDDFDVEQDRIFIYDTKFDAKIPFPQDIDGYPTWQRQALEQRFDLVIGCSGYKSFAVDDFIFVEDGGLLVSCSSGQIEFGRKELIEMADLHQNDDIKINKPLFNEYDMHADIPLQLPHRRITMLNGAWPINFSGSPANIPADYFQPTVCMMLHGALQAIQAMRSKQSGLIELENAWGKNLIERFKDFLGSDKQVVQDSID